MPPLCLPGLSSGHLFSVYLPWLGILSVHDSSQPSDSSCSKQARSSCLTWFAMSSGVPLSPQLLIKDMGLTGSVSSLVAPCRCLRYFRMPQYNILKPNYIWLCEGQSPGPCMGIVLSITPYKTCFTFQAFCLALKN